MSKKRETALSQELKTGIESLAGIDLDEVKVHYNTEKPEQLKPITQGKNIHLGENQDNHLPHEAWHVVQQQQGQVKPATKLHAMHNTAIPFQAIKWGEIEPTIHAGETGTAYWRTLQLPGLRIRMVDYSANYLADHWCEKGHIVHCLAGTFVSELKTGELFELHAGMSYVVSDEMSSHRSIAKDGVKLLIIDGDFLKQLL